MEPLSESKRRWADIVLGAVFGFVIAIAIVRSLLPPIASPFDGNGDDSIDAGEFRSMMASMFEQIDANGDGIVDQTELSNAHSKLRPSLAQTITMTFRIVKLDKERDVKLSKIEVLDRGRWTQSSNS